MNSKFFVKKSHLHGEVFLLIPYVGCVGLIALTAVQLKSITAPELIFIVVATLITLPLCIRFRSMGLYISGKDITVKKIFTTHKIAPHDIVAIKILQSYYSVGLADQPIVDEKGTPHFTAFLLHSVTDAVCKFRREDTRFLRMYHKHIICGVVSDLEAIEYLKTLNPRIRII